MLLGSYGPVLIAQCQITQAEPCLFSPWFTPVQLLSLLLSREPEQPGGLRLQVHGSQLLAAVGKQAGFLLPAQALLILRMMDPSGHSSPVAPSPSFSLHMCFLIWQTQ